MSGPGESWGFLVGKKIPSLKLIVKRAMHKSGSGFNFLLKNVNFVFTLKIIYVNVKTVK